MDELWPTPSPEVADIMRTLCQRLVQEVDSLTDSIAQPALVAQNQAAMLADASLLAEDHQLTRSELVQWLTSNVQRPGMRVEPYVGPRTQAYIGDLVSRGIAPDFASGWRAALTVAWRVWLEHCIQHCDDRALLTELLHVSGTSLVQYALDSLSALREVSVAAAMGDADAEAIALIQLVASGAPVMEDIVESRLGYRLTRQHVALVLWVDDASQAEVLNEAIRDVRRTEAGRTSLVARASATSRWLWLSSVDTPLLPGVQEVLSGLRPLRVAVGRPGYGLEGFRSSHQDALAAQALVVRLDSSQKFTSYAEVELIDALTKDRESAARFVLKTLGPLAHAEESLRTTLLTYVQSGFNTTRAAARLYAHRNTVERRVSKADELSMVKLEDNPTHVAAALLVLQVAPDLVPR